MNVQFNSDKDGKVHVMYALPQFLREVKNICDKQNIKMFKKGRMGFTF